MTDNLNKLEVVEKELASYRVKFKESSDILGDLGKIQDNFKGLAQKYQDLKDEHQKLTEHFTESRKIVTALQTESKTAVEQVIQTNETVQHDFTNLQHEIVDNFTEFQKALQDESRQISAELQTESKKAIDEILQSQKSFQQNFANLEQDVIDNFTQSQEYLNQHFAGYEQGAELKWQKFQQEIALKLNTFDDKIKGFQEELDTKILHKLENVVNSQQTIQQNFKNFESELRDTKIAIQEVRDNHQQQLEQSQKRISKVEEYVTGMSTSVNQTRNIIYMIGAGTVLALVLAIASFFMPPKETTSRQTQTSQLSTPANR